MIWVLSLHHVIIVSLLSVLPRVIIGPEVTSFDDDEEPTILSCDKISFSDEVGCICITGLWRLYGDCFSYYSVAGNAHCLYSPQIRTKDNQLHHVKYAMEILPNKASIAVIRNGSKVIPLTPKRPTRMLLLHDLVVTGSAHTLTGSRGSICVHPQEGAYCTYNPREYIGREIEHMEKGCQEDLPFISPVTCDFEKEPQTCRAASYNSFVKQAYENRIGEEKLRKRHKRAKPKSSARKNYGRTFLGAPGQVLDRNVDQLEEEDEDFMDEATLGNMTESSSDDVLSEIWNYIDMQAEIVMGLRENRSSEIDYGIPYFKLLHQSKRVMQRLCPAEYVAPGFFDIATQAFIQIQVKRLIYEEPNANFPGFERIMQALKACGEDVEPFPFVVPTPGSNASCSPNGTGGGQYLAHFNDTPLEINVTLGFIGLDHDPIIETAWKIFFATQTYCFKYFNTSGERPSTFNDHHRYTAWMSNLFTNGILETWEKNNATEFTYDKFLGDMTDVMVKVAYCAASSKFNELYRENEYPWELKRPSLNGSAEAAPAEGGGTRKKRRVESSTSCLASETSSTCFSKANRWHLWNDMSQR